MQVNKIGEYILKMYNKNVIDFKKNKQMNKN